MGKSEIKHELKQTDYGNVLITTRFTEPKEDKYEFVVDTQLRMREQLTKFNKLLVNVHVTYLNVKCTFQNLSTVFKRRILKRKTKDITDVYFEILDRRTEITVLLNEIRGGFDA